MRKLIAISALIGCSVGLQLRANERKPTHVAVDDSAVEAEADALLENADEDEEMDAAVQKLEDEGEKDKKKTRSAKAAKKSKSHKRAHKRKHKKHRKHKKVKHQPKKDIDEELEDDDLDPEDPINQLIKELDEESEEEAEADASTTPVKVEHGKLPDGHHLRRETHTENGKKVTRISSGDTRPEVESDPLDEVFHHIIDEDAASKGDIEPVVEKRAPKKHQPKNMKNKKTKKQPKQGQNDWEGEPKEKKQNKKIKAKKIQDWKGTNNSTSVPKEVKSESKQDQKDEMKNLVKPNDPNDVDLNKSMSPAYLILASFFAISSLILGFIYLLCSLKKKVALKFRELKADEGPEQIEILKSEEKSELNDNEALKAQEQR